MEGHRIVLFSGSLQAAGTLAGSAQGAEGCRDRPASADGMFDARGKAGYLPHSLSSHIKEDSLISSL